MIVTYMGVSFGLMNDVNSPATYLVIGNSPGGSPTCQIHGIARSKLFTKNKGCLEPSPDLETKLLDVF